jgi:hypothetical protein
VIIPESEKNEHLPEKEVPERPFFSIDSED